MWVAGGAILLFGAACNRGADTDSSTTTSTSDTVATTPVTAGSSATTSPPVAAPESTTTTSEAPVLGIPEYRIVSRVAGDGGDIVVVLLDPTSYNELTDVDLQNVVGDVVEQFPPILEAHVVDSADAVEAVLAENPTPEQLALLDEHYFVRFEEGFRMVFVGQFDAVGDVILGS